MYPSNPHDIKGHVSFQAGAQRMLDTYNTGQGIRITLWNQRGNVIDSIVIDPESARQLAGDLETLADIIESEQE